MVTSTENSYAVIDCKSNFSFLEGASHPEELVAAAAALRLPALAITDRNGVYGIVRAHVAAKEHGVKLLIGATLAFPQQELVVLATSRQGYANLCRLISRLRQDYSKDETPWLTRNLLATYQNELLFLAKPPYDTALLPFLKDLAGERLWLVLQRLLQSDDQRLQQQAVAASRRFGCRLVAGNDVHYHTPRRQALQDVLTAIRHHTTVQTAGYRLFSNAERYLKSPAQMARLFEASPQAVNETLAIAERCHFSLDELRYIYPDEFLPPGETVDGYLRHLTLQGLQRRYPQGAPEKVRRQMENELKLIGSLKFADYFLTIHDIVTYACSRNILCQGRGSAANSTVCYLLGITSIDPVRMDLLFERFISAERGEPPDIDIDFEHERREEVIQYIYQRYGRERASLVAEVITYRTRSATAEVNKALGELADTPQAEKLIAEIKGFPRHLSTHVGGFVLTRDPLIENVPIENAAMADRTIIQWNKDDLDALGMLKVDVLGLGMLTCLRKCFEYLPAEKLTLANLPAEDPKVYDMICRADTIGVFQVESRAQMSMLPRLLPRTFHDLVVELAIVRPGPIVGKMIHPYLRRRRGEEKVSYPHPALQEILGKTYGVPLFQEQVMKIAIQVGGFNPGEADQLRRAMGIWRTSRSASMLSLAERLINGMKKNGLNQAQAEQIFKQIQSFGEFGFPESHSASFALLAYASAYMKCYYPAAFTCATLNSQPMGFYAAHTLIDDLKRHGGEVRPLDVNHSQWDCTLEANNVLRVGLRYMRGLHEKTGRRIEAEKQSRPFDSLEDFIARTAVSRVQASYLAAAGAFTSFKLSRREALWKLLALPFAESDLFGNDDFFQTTHAFKPLTPIETVNKDYLLAGHSTEAHPLGLFRDALNAHKVACIQAIDRCANGSKVRVAGMVIVRQRPPTAKGMVFLTLEDESGLINIAIRPEVYGQLEATVLGNAFLIVDGKLQRDGEAVSILASGTQGLSMLGEQFPAIRSRDFH